MTDERRYGGRTWEEWEKYYADYGMQGMYPDAFHDARREIDRLTAEVSRLAGGVARQRAADAQSRIIPHGAPILGRRLVRQAGGAYFYEYKPIGEDVHART